MGAMFLSRWREAPWLNAVLGAFLLNAALAVVLIALSHAPGIGQPDEIELFEHVLGLMSGPLLFALVHQAGSDGSHRRFSWLHFLPALAALTYAVTSLLVPLEDVLGALPVVTHQFAYTILATVCLAREGRLRTWPAAIVLAVWAIHLAQCVRIAWPDTRFLRDVVPVAGTIALNVFVVVALYHSSLLAGLVPRRRYARSGVARGDLARMANALQAALDAAALHRQRDLTLSRLAAHMGWNEHATSQVINEAMGTNFNALVRTRRVADAKVLLGDAANRRFSVEGLGLEAGFGSRAAFYKAFNEDEGISPAEYRKRILGLSS